MSDPISDILNRHQAERKALLDRFELELRNPTVEAFVRPNTEDRLGLHGGCSIICAEPFTIVFVDARGCPCAHLVYKKGGVGMDLLGRDPQVIAVGPEAAVRLHAWGSTHLSWQKSSMRCEIWSVDAATLYFQLHTRHMAEVMPLLEAEVADGKAAEVKP